MKLIKKMTWRCLSLYYCISFPTVLFLIVFLLSIKLSWILLFTFRFFFFVANILILSPYCEIKMIIKKLDLLCCLCFVYNFLLFLPPKQPKYSFTVYLGLITLILIILTFNFISSSNQNLFFLFSMFLSGAIENVNF